MSIERNFEETIEELKTAAKNLPDDADKAIIEKTAIRLEGLNYAPSVITPNHHFLRMKKEDVLREIDRILEMPEQEACALAPGDDKKCQDLRIQFIKVILYYYEKLILLRQGDADEWDEIDELYVHD